MTEARRSVRWLAGALIAFVAGLLLARLHTPLLWLAATPLAFAGLELLTLRRTLQRLAAARPQAGEAEAARLAAAVAESRAKSRFLAEMSHELRTPLNAVIGFSEMMAQEVLGPHQVPAYRDYAQDIHASGRHLLSLADDILDLARIETGHRQLFETAVSLGTLAQDCAHMMRLAATGRAIALEVEEAARPRLWADERAVRQMVLNLLSNAVKFTPEGGTVRLVVDCAPDGAPCLAVEDTGPGMGEAELPLTPSPHHRESRLDPASGRGAGLGLAIVQGLAGLHGARLDFSDRAAGGTRATLTFPVARRLGEAAAPAEPLRPAALLAAAE
ncbi:sensor histidine kinase [Azorhizobium doebereinerae]|uniref:sensor histidine kinase n=1 Tax=Azorhizobium doebereinerae TaxID=281091 RepID=UPI0004220CFB|nr:HAMP domain-containing sensor histidine kinase [Azorhizobium doebereinerae]